MTGAVSDLKSDLKQNRRSKSIPPQGSNHPPAKGPGLSSGTPSAADVPFAELEIIFMMHRTLCRELSIDEKLFAALPCVQAWSANEEIEFAAPEYFRQIGQVKSVAFWKSPSQHVGLDVDVATSVKTKLALLQLMTSRVDTTTFR
eukprot:TRINITY_DN33775_c0_g1_i1.p2 TRINITY_DN33775_c0_g1~~TRINITY_DN33775_c0_g1_i1.p2  ORF type:complete len:145 (-),score=16.66 TRINITY_DN33775_c0_g1_i1:414-848(-)